MTYKSEYFYGHKVSDYGLENGYVDYRTLASCFDHVLNADIVSKTWGVFGEWELLLDGVDREHLEELKERLDELEDKEIELTARGRTDTDAYNRLIDEMDAIKDEIEYIEDYTPDIFQYYIVPDYAVPYLEEANEIVYYNTELELYVWGVAHWGTSWDYVLTNIKLELEEEEEEQ